MDIHLLKKLDIGVTSQGDRVVRVLVTIGQFSHCYFVGIERYGEPQYKSGHFFITGTMSKQYYDLYLKSVDPEVQLSPTEEREFMETQGRSYSDMMAYIGD